MKTEWTLHADTMANIIKDIATNTHPAESKMEYSEEMVRFYNEVKADWEAWKKDHPDAVLEVPHDLPE